MKAPSSRLGDLLGISSLPNPSDALSEPHIVRLKFIKANSYNERCNLERPLEDLPRGCVLPLWNIVGDD